MAEDYQQVLPQVQTALNRFQGQYEAAYYTAMAAKLGLATIDSDNMREQVEAQVIGLLDVLAQDKLDYTLSFRYLMEQLPKLAVSTDRELVISAFTPSKALVAWQKSWLQWLLQHTTAESAWACMAKANPLIIPRNHQVESAIQAAYAGDMTVFERLYAAVVSPFELAPENADLLMPPSAGQCVDNTFCGT